VQLANKEELDSLAHKVSLDQRDLRETLALLEILAPRVRLAQLDLRVTLALPDHKETLETPDRMEIQDRLAQ